jgi:hypothetical protein
MNSTKLFLFILISEILVCKAIANETQSMVVDPNQLDDPTPNNDPNQLDDPTPYNNPNQLDDPMLKCRDEFCWPKCCRRDQLFHVDVEQCGPMPESLNK